MSAGREAVLLPLLLLTVVLLGGLDPGAANPWTTASPFSLLLAMLMLAALVRSGALAPERLMRNSRSMLENANGCVVLVTLFAASAQLLHMLTPRTGLPALLVGIVLFLLLLNTLAVEPDRPRMLRSLGVLVASAFVLKFVVLAALADPAAGRTRRVLIALFDAATLGSVTQAPLHPSAGYIAFATALLFLIAVAALPPRSSDSRSLVRSSPALEP